jgi:RNA polymerase sigma factor (sigma-70 family)
MPAGQLEGVIRHLRRVARQGDVVPVGDAELLERFIARRDEAAFALLVHRHGPMVLGVCRRVLRDAMDAEDAFQATFLVLVRKAPSIVPRSQLAPWLHGVAHKTALKAKAMNRRRRVKEREAGAAQARNAPATTWDPLLEILDGELSALPEKYRAPILLCDLEGLSYKEAAARLGCPPGTLSGRLTRARALLARRVSRRCPPVTAAALPALLARAVPVAVSPSLKACTIRAGAHLAAGKALSESAVPAKVALLAQGVLKMLLLSKLKTVTVGLLLLAAVVATGSTWATWGSARAAMPDSDPAAWTEGDPTVSASKVDQANSPMGSPEAVFIFRGAEAGRKAVSLVVEGTSAPVICLPIQKDVRVMVGGRTVGIDGLTPGSRIAIRLDATNHVIEGIRALERPRVTVLRSVRDLSHLAPPSEAEVLRALQQQRRNDPAVIKISYDNISLEMERLAKQVEPPRLYPLVGQAELHHGHWKCTAHYLETVEISEPYPLRIQRPRVEVVYLDQDYLVPTE